MLKAARDGLSLRAVLEAILLGRFESAVVEGRTLVRTSEGGGSVEFSIPEGLTPAELMNLAADGLAWLERQPNPETAALPRPVKRLRVCFDRASL